MPTPSIAEVKESLVSTLNSIVDPTSGHALSVDTNDVSDVVGVFVNYIVAMTNNLLEIQLRYRNTFNYQKAVGAELRDIISYLGIVAKAATATTTDVIFVGKAGSTVPYCHILSEDESKDFVYVGGGVIGQDGSLTVKCSSAVLGEIQLNNGELVKTNPSLQNVSSVTNSNVIVGRNEESDNEIKLRISRMLSTIGYGFLEIIDSALMNIDGVVSASTFADDSTKNIPNGSLTCVVNGGDDKAIAKTIFEKNVFLYSTIGNTDVTVKSERGNEYTISFTRPTIKELKVQGFYAFREKSETISNEEIINIVYPQIKNYLSKIQPNSTIYAEDISNYVNSLNTSFLLATCYIGYTASTKYRETVAWNEIVNLTIENLKLTQTSS